MGIGTVYCGRGLSVRYHSIEGQGSEWAVEISDIEPGYRGCIISIPNAKISIERNDFVSVCVKSERLQYVLAGNNNWCGIPRQVENLVPFSAKSWVKEEI